jgi:hypothetical protein
MQVLEQLVVAHNIVRRFDLQGKHVDTCCDKAVQRLRSGLCVHHAAKLFECTLEFSNPAFSAQTLVAAHAGVIF